MCDAFRTRQTFIVLGSFIVLCTLFAGCHQDQNKTRQHRQAIKPRPTSVEQQLVATVRHAEKLGQGNPLLLSSLYNLANFYRDHKEYDKAAHQYQRVLDIKEQMNGLNHPDIAAILRQYAQVLQEAKRPTQAANLLARANTISAQSNPPSRRQ